MPGQNICGFCGRPAENVVEGPNGAYACVQCLIASREIIAQMAKMYTCSFCFEDVPSGSVVMGPNNLYMCSACVESGIRLLSK